MPKISFNRDFNLLKINNVNVHRIRIPLNYSIFRPHKPRFDYHSSKLIFNATLWMNNFNEDPFRKSLFYFFQWDWAGGFFREFFLAPLHTNFYLFMGSPAQVYRTPIEEYSVPYWLSFFRTVSSARYRNVNRSYDFLSQQLHTYDRSLIFDRFTYNPNFRGLNPYELVVNSQTRPFSSFYDFVSKPGARQQSIFAKSQIIKHRNFFPKIRRDENVVGSRSGAFLKRHYLNLYKGHAPVMWSQGRDFERYNTSVLGGVPDISGHEHRLKHRNKLNLNNKRRVYYMHVSIFWKFIFKIYSIIFEVSYMYCMLWFFCYKQIILILVLILFARLYFYGVQVSFYEYRYMLLEYKNFLIFTNQLYTKKEHFSIPETNFEKTLLRIFPSFYNQPEFALSYKYISFRRFLMYKFFREFFFIFFVRPWFEIYFIIISFFS